MSADKQIVLWRLNHKERPTALINLTHNKEITYFDVFSNYVVVG